MASLNRSRHSKASLLASGLGAAALLAVAHGAAAAASTASITVSATVASTCIVAANPLSFGTYQPGQGSVSARTTLAVTCTKGAPFTLALSAGSGGTLVQRLMTMGTNQLQYNLYTTAAHQTVWGDGTQGSATVAGVGHGFTESGAITETVYGQLPDSAANVNLAPGLYTDTIMVTVAY